MNETCIVCGAPATRVAKSAGGKETAYVCGAPHARSWQRSVKRVKLRGAMTPSTSSGSPPLSSGATSAGYSAAAAEVGGRVLDEKFGGRAVKRLGENRRGLTYLGGKPVK